MYIAGAKIFPSTPDVSPPVETTTPQAGSKMERGGEHSHTPGPWYPCQNTAGTWQAQIGAGPYDQIVFWAGTSCPEYFLGDPEANVRLAAAAPEMLERLENCIMLIMLAMRRDAERTLKTLGPEAIRKTHELISKATGVTK